MYTAKALPETQDM